MLLINWKNTGGMTIFCIFFLYYIVIFRKKHLKYKLCLFELFYIYTDSSNVQLFIDSIYLPIHTVRFIIVFWH